MTKAVTKQFLRPLNLEVNFRQGIGGQNLQGFGIESRKKRDRSRHADPIIWPIAKFTNPQGRRCEIHVLQEKRVTDQLGQTLAPTPGSPAHTQHAASLENHQKNNSPSSASPNNRPTRRPTITNIIEFYRQ